MSQQNLQNLIKAFRGDLAAMDAGTYVAPLPHRSMVKEDELDAKIDAELAQKSSRKAA
jgi:hypothetical protein